MRGLCIMQAAAGRVRESIEGWRGCRRLRRKWEREHGHLRHGCATDPARSSHSGEFLDAAEKEREVAALLAENAGTVGRWLADGESVTLRLKRRIGSGPEGQKPVLTACVRHRGGMLCEYTEIWSVAVLMRDRDAEEGFRVKDAFYGIVRYMRRHDAMGRRRGRRQVPAAGQRWMRTLRPPGREEKALRGRGRPEGANP